MRLTLSTLRCPASTAHEARSFDGGEISLGRGPDNDWVLADPERHLSKRHCTLAFRGGSWQVSDQSTNGTFVNGESDPLGLAGLRRLHDGDRIVLGDYELEVRLSQQRAGTWADPHAPQHYDRDPFVNPFHVEPSGTAPGGPAIHLPSDFDPIAPAAEPDWHRPTRADNVPATSYAFTPPAVAAMKLPEDWADDLLPGPATPLPGPAPNLPPSLPPLTMADGPPPVEARPVQAAAEPLRAAPAPAAGPSLLDAFLRGAGVEGTPVADPAALMEQMGATMRAMVTGLRQALIARAEVKSEFRIERTMISASGNNPLKFSADDDDALAALLGSRASNMPATAAVADALEELRLHELATMAALQTAVRDVVARLDPAALKRTAGTGGLPTGRKARAWDAFEALHASVTEGLLDDFDSVFGKSFARAYERAQNEIAASKARIP